MTVTVAPNAPSPPRLRKEPRIDLFQTLHALTGAQAPALETKDGLLRDGPNNLGLGG